LVFGAADGGPKTPFSLLQKRVKEDILWPR
jgi:hypothetical protein